MEKLLLKIYNFLNSLSNKDLKNAKTIINILQKERKKILEQKRIKLENKLNKINLFFKTKI